MQISKVKLVDGGLKGIEVHYVKHEEKDGYSFNNEYISKRKAPIHRELRKAFEKLTVHLDTICYLADAESEVTGITAGENSFLISGKCFTLNNSVFAINTPNVKEESGYDQFDDVMKIVDEIYKEARIYLELKKVADVKQFVIDFGKSLDPDGTLNIAGMSEEEQTELMVKTLEKKGCIVVAPTEEELETGAEIINENLGKENEEDNFPGEEKKDKKLKVA